MEYTEEQKKKYQELRLYIKENGPAIRKKKAKVKKMMQEKEYAGYEQGKLLGMRWRYRHWHIAYSELRGRKREQIERPAADNLPDEKLILKIKEEVIEAQLEKV